MGYNGPPPGRWYGSPTTDPPTSPPPPPPPPPRKHVPGEINHCAPAESDDESGNSLLWLVAGFFLGAM